MVRNAGCESSDGCAAAVLERLVTDPGWIPEEPGRVTLFRWLEAGRDGEPRPAGTGGAVDRGGFPVFELGSFRFTVKTGDLRLIGDLRAFAASIAGLPRADVKFTSKLVRCTEKGLLGGWAWQKERIPAV